MEEPEQDAAGEENREQGVEVDAGGRRDERRLRLGGQERGADAAGITVGGGPVSGTLASVFCIPATGNGLIDGAADLPGPGATSLPGTLELL